MSLVVRVSINDTTLYWVTAQRIKGGTDPDSVNTYKVQRIEMDGTLSPPVDHGTVEHRYGDPASALVDKMFERVRIHEEWGDKAVSDGS